MQYGSPLPITAFPDAAAVRAYAEALETAGFDFTSTSGHVLGQPSGTNPQRPDRQYVGPFYDPMVTFSYLAAITKRLRFITGILILPAWPTVLAAKQAAELALFSGGRFELGVGISWNAAEYRALGQEFHGRGRRIEEQIEVMRLLWSQPYVTFEGRYHKLDKLGLNRAAVPRIPIWFGTESGEKALRRVARLADGWMSLGDPTPDLPRLRQYMQEAGRDPKQLMVRGPLVVGAGGKAAWVAAGRKLQDAGVTHINVVAPPDVAPAQALPRLVEARQALAEALG
ncbi:MAG: TIGR03619 family F420-dependent LLM class oxidoreductase [Alphaproteobacteria bacterium]|nr:TIGR03619 family F420-dependent LLM class oxidoreductase [Alphaproteobacteria bacterium]